MNTWRLSSQKTKVYWEKWAKVHEFACVSRKTKQCLRSSTLVLIFQVHVNKNIFYGLYYCSHCSWIIYFQNVYSEFCLFWILLHLYCFLLHCLPTGNQKLHFAHFYSFWILFSALQDIFFIKSITFCKISYAAMHPGVLFKLAKTIFPRHMKNDHFHTGTKELTKK